MSRYRNAIASKEAHIATLRIACVVLIITCAGLWWGWKSTPNKLIIHNPPDLRSGSTRAWWEIDPANVYSFSFYIWQRLNCWHVNGEEDYKRNIHMLKAYFTPACRIILEQEYERRKSRAELRKRVRGIAEIPGRGYSPASVRIHGRDTWTVDLDLVIDEQYEGVPVRDVFIRYPLRVIRADTNPEHNPWGLQIDCFDGSPQRLAIMSSEGER